MNSLLTFILIVFSFQESPGAVVYSEHELLEKVQESPNLISTAANLELINSRLSQLLDGFSLQFRGSGFYKKTNEIPLIQFQPPEDPFVQGTLGVAQKTKYGVGFEASVIGESFTSGSTIDSARFGPSLKISIDLWKNRFGIESRNRVSALEAQVKAVESEKGLLEESIKNSIQKLFWNYNILKKQLGVTQKLVKLAGDLVQDLSAKQKDGFIEAGPLLEARSQLTTQKTQVYLFKYQLSQLRKGLKEIIPGLAPVFDLDEVGNLADLHGTFVTCIKRLDGLSETPLDLSLFTENLRANKEEAEYSSKVAKRIGKPTLTFEAALSNSHVDPSFGQVVQDFSEESKFGYSFGLQLSMPLSSNLKKARTAETNAQLMKYKALESRINAQMTSLHHQTKEAVMLLKEAYDNQSASSKNLKKSYRFKKKLFDQARAEFGDLITEQNRLLSSEISELSIAQTIIEQVLSYKSVFHKFSCNEVK